MAHALAAWLLVRATPRKVNQIPYFAHLKENDPRQGFVDDRQYALLMKHCEESWLRVLLAVAYSFGFRKGELLGLRVKQVDLLERTITLDPGTTKNKDGKVVAMTREVFHLLSEAVRAKGPDDFVFTREGGTPIADVRDAWYAMYCAAGLGRMECKRSSKSATKGKCEDCGSKSLCYVGLILHDLRRSAVRNMMRRGVPQAVAMKISGHRTLSVFNRYNIVSEEDLKDAAQKIENGRDAAHLGPATVCRELETRKPGLIQ